MLTLEETEALTGHPIGGVTPFGLASDLPVYMDQSLESFDFVFPAAGSPSSALKITPQKMKDLTKAVVVDVTK